MRWELEGSYFENCSCTWVCPCTVTSLVMPATEDRCRFLLAYHIDRGQVGGLDVSGLSAAILGDTPKQMADGNWNVGLILDERASDEQADALVAIFSGRDGGPMAALAPLIGNVLGIERAPIDFRSENGHHSARIGSDIEIAVEDFTPEGLDRPTRVDGVFHPSNSTLTVARPVTSRISAFGMTLHNEGRSAFSAPFNWSA